MSEVMQIHCPSCGVRLGIPGDAGGRMARCPKCNNKFKVPDPRQMLDDTITCWLNLDQMGDDEHGESVTQEIEMQRSAMGMAPPKEDKPETPEPATPPAPEPPKTEKPEPVRRVLRSRSKKNDRADTPAQADTVNDQASPDDTQTPAADGKHGIAESVNNHQNHIHLTVVDVTSAGVRFAFSSRLIDIPQFRASMPMCDVYTGDYSSDNLIARPLAWIDKASGKFTNPGELEARYEYTLKQHQTAREVIDSMRIMNELPSPFSQPMPYYVAGGSGKAPIHCETYQTPKGIVCEVTIPSPAVALDWLGRVNGVCCQEYVELEQTAHKLEASAWRAIPEKVRKRLAAWFDFQGDESFLAYFNDGDFASSDSGLAGLVVTTDRLAYCKYHSGGSIQHNKSVTLVAVESGRFVTLVLQGRSSNKRIMKLKTSDLDELVTLLDQVDSNIELVMQEGTVA